MDEAHAVRYGAKQTDLRLRRFPISLFGFCLDLETWWSTPSAT